MQVTRLDEKLAALTKPVLQPTSQFKLCSGDCVIVCAGFEERAVGVLRNALAFNSDFTVLSVSYEPFLTDNRANEIGKLCRAAGLKQVEVKYDRQNPADFGYILLEEVRRIRGRVFLDVSAMSRLLIVQCLVALRARDGGLVDCVVAYAEATDYPPNPSQVSDALKLASEDPMHTILLLSSGVFDVTVVPELSSTSIAGVQTRLIAFPTFSADQLMALLNELGPSRLTVIHGIPPNEHNKWRTEAIAKINGLDRLTLDSVRTSTLDYRETLDALLKLYALYSEREHLLVSPTGSKMQTVAVGLFRAFLHDVQVVYPTPKKFLTPSTYTTGVGRLYSLPLEAFTC